MNMYLPDQRKALILSLERFAGQRPKYLPEGVLEVIRKRGEKV